MRCLVMSLTLLNQHMLVYLMSFTGICTLRERSRPLLEPPLSVTQHMLVHLIWQVTVTLYFVSELVSMITWYVIIMATIQHVCFRVFRLGLNTLLAPGTVNVIDCMKLKPAPTARPSGLARQAHGPPAEFIYT